MVPNGWEWTNLGKLANKVGSGVTPKGGSNSYKSSGIPLIRSQNVLWGTLDLKGVAFIDDSQHEKMKGSIVCKGDVLLNITGASIGRAAVSNVDEANVNQHVCIIRSDKLDPEFLRDFLLSFNGQKQIEQFQAGGNRQGLNFEQIKSFKLPFPPLPEQRKIATILGTWDKAISTTERLIDNSKQQKKALMQQLLTGKKRLFDNSSKPFKKEWQLKLFKEILRLDRGSSPRPIVNFTTEDSDGVNWIKIGDTKNDTSYITSTKEKISLEGAKKSRRVSSGEIIVSNSMSYGKPYILKIDGCIHDGWFVLRDYQEHIDTTFLIQLLSSEFVQAQYKRLAAGGVVTNISSELVYAVKVNLPQISEQRKIAAVLSNTDKEIVLFEKQLADLKQEKKAMMQQLLTGKRRVKVDDEALA